MSESIKQVSIVLSEIADHPRFPGERGVQIKLDPDNTDKPDNELSPVEHTALQMIQLFQAYQGWTGARQMINGDEMLTVRPGVQMADTSEVEWPEDLGEVV